MIILRSLGMLGVPASINELIMLCRSGLSYGAVVGDGLKSEGSIVSSGSLVYVSWNVMVLYLCSFFFF